MSKPVIILAFADSRDDLPELRDERASLYRMLEPWFTISQRERATLKSIEESFRNFEGQVRIFHFGGHADPERLEFLAEDGGSSAAYIKGLASFIGRQESVELAFLNGCSTQAQIEEFFKAGVPAIIATEALVKDKVARDFAFFFYENFVSGSGNTSLIEAFNRAKDQLNSRYNGYLIQEDATRDRLDQQTSKLDADDVFLLKTAGARSGKLCYHDLLAPLPDDQDQNDIPKKIPPIDAHLLCDRHDEARDFRGYVIDSLNEDTRKPIISLIYGEEQELPLKLAERFEKFTLRASFKKIDRVWDKDLFEEMTISMPLLGDYKGEFKAMDVVKEALHEAFQLRLFPRKKIRSLKSTDILKEVPDHKQMYLLNHLIYPDHWHPQKSLIFMQQYLETFWNLHLQTGQPDIVLLFTLQYPKSTGFKSWFKKKVNVSEAFEEKLILPKLKPVPRKDVKMWNDLYASDDSTLTDRMYGNKKHLPMQDILDQLKAVIDRLRS